MDHFNSLGNNCLPDQAEKQKELLKIGGEYLVIFLINKLILEEMKLLSFSKVSNFSNIILFHCTRLAFNWQLFLKERNKLINIKKLNI